MKKTLLSMVLLILVFALSACSSNATESPTANSATTASTTGDNTENGNTSNNGERQFTLPTELTLMLGTVKLEETDYAVDAQQAAALLPLWKALRSLSESDTAAQAEIDALITQIGETMTPEQTSSIAEMDLTMQDMTAVMETLGIETSNLGGGYGEMTPEMQSTMEAARANGETPEGGRPGGGMGIGGGMGPGGGVGGAEMDPEARATAMAEREGTRGARTGINSIFLDAIIDFLETKVTH